MEIQMKKTYRGPIGTFLDGQVYDVGDSVVKRIPKDAYKNIEPEEDCDSQATVEELPPTTGKKSKAKKA